MIRIECPFCEEVVEAPKEWVIKNERVYCNNCSKSFPVMLQSKEEDKPNEESELSSGDWDFGF